MSSQFDVNITILDLIDKSKGELISKPTKERVKTMDKPYNKFLFCKRFANKKMVTGDIHLEFDAEGKCPLFDAMEMDPGVRAMLRQWNDVKLKEVEKEVPEISEEPKVEENKVEETPKDEVKEEVEETSKEDKPKKGRRRKQK